MTFVMSKNETVYFISLQNDTTFFSMSFSVFSGVFFLSIWHYLMCKSTYSNEEEKKILYSQLGLTLVWCLVPITFIFWISSSYVSDIADTGLKFTGIDTGWHWSCLLIDDDWDILDLLLNACDTIDESIHIGI